ncbi:MAG TPA: Ig-like domain-containing protein, partial [Catalimonadaceae bacterium]|nr:Ig-like domain-containing protein [Catalimonadaceae bacterium]
MTAILLFGNQKLWAQTLPYSNSFESADTSFILQKSGDTLAWRIANGGISSSNCLLSEYVTNSSGDQAVGYFAAKRLNLIVGHTYQVSFQSKVQYSNRRKIKLALNTTANRDSATLIHDFGTLAASESYQPYSTTFSVETSGQFFLIYYAEIATNQIQCLWYTDDFSVTVINTPPSVTLVEPTHNSWFNPDQSVGFAATVSDGENNVAKVEFYEGANKVAEDFTPNGLGLYTASYLPANGGTQTLSAKAIDSLGASATSNSRTINVRYLPQASITNLTAYSNYFPGLQRVTATASDQDGTVQYVVFYLNEDSIGTDSTAPYEIDVPLGYDENEEHRYIYARAVDNDGLIGSDAVRINVVPGTCSLTTPNSTLRQTMCMGDSIELSSEGENGTTGFQWLFKSNSEEAWATTYSTKPKLYAHQAGLYAISWTYENNAVCTTAVDTVSVFEVRGEVLIPTDSPYTAAAHGFGGNEPYMYSWNTGTCLDQICNAITVSDLSSYIIVTAQDNNACAAQDTIEIGSGCIGNQMTWLNNLHIENYAFKMETAESKFQNFISEQNEILSQISDKNLFPGEEITIPVVFGVYNNPDDHTGGFNDGYIKGLFTSQISNQIQTLNSVFSANKYTVGGKTYTIRFCLAQKD